MKNLKSFKPSILSRLPWPEFDKRQKNTQIEEDKE